MTIDISPEHPSAATGIAAPRERRGSRLLAAAVIAAPLAVATAVTIHPADTGGAARTLARLAGEDRVMWTIAHVLETYGWLFVGTTLLLALPRLAPDRGRRLVVTGAVLAFIGYASLAFVVYGHGEAYLVMSGEGMDPSAMTPVFEQYQDGMPLAAIPSLLARIGVLLAGIGLLFGRRLPYWVAALVTISPLLASVQPTLPLPLGLLAAFGPMTVAMIAAAPKIADAHGSQDVVDAVARG
jgi:hypothetical protein